MRLLGVDMVNLRRRRDGGGERAKRERLAVMDALEGVSATVGLGAPRATGGVECRVIGGFREVNQGWTWIVEESYDVTSGGVRRLLNFAKPSGTVRGVVPDRGSDRQRGG